MRKNMLPYNGRCVDFYKLCDFTLQILLELIFYRSADQSSRFSSVRNLTDKCTLLLQMLTVLRVSGLPKSSKLEIIVLVQISFQCYEMNKQHSKRKSDSLRYRIL